MKRLLQILFPALLLASGLSSCNFLFGSKQDDQVDDVLKQGAIDPNLVPNTVGYVPILPIWSNFQEPTDVFVGYDEMVYVVDKRGLNILDLKGTFHRLIPIPGATKVTQDRRIHTYVIGRYDTVLNGESYNIAAIYHLRNASQENGPIFVDTILHYFNDNSRFNTNFRGTADAAVEFTGVSCIADNTLYVSRKGPTNSPSSISANDNAVLIYDPNGANLGYAIGLNAISSSIKSAVQPSGIGTFIGPPQLAFGMNTTADFLLLQGSPQAEYKVLWIKQSFNPETGPEYTGNPALLNFDTSKADGFLYAPFRFGMPADVCVAPDETRNIFVVDSQKDSLYQFSPAGFEGVIPPAASGLTKLIKTSFGGSGSGPFQFKQPSGVAYFRRMLYVADKGNNRVIRYRLNTDLER